MSIKVRRHNSHSPEPTLKVKGAGTVWFWQSHIFLTTIFFKVKKFTPKKCDNQN